MNSIFKGDKTMTKRKKAAGLPAKYAKIVLGRLDKKGGNYYTLQMVYNVATGRTENMEIQLEIMQLRKERLEAKKRILELRFEISELEEFIKQKPT